MSRSRGSMLNIIVDVDEVWWLKVNGKGRSIWDALVVSERDFFA